MHLLRESRLFFVCGAFSELKFGLLGGKVIKRLKSVAEESDVGQIGELVLANFAYDLVRVNLCSILDYSGILG